MGGETVREEWRDIPGYESLYQVSNQGRVKSLARTRRTKGGVFAFHKERILKPGRSAKKYGGHLNVVLCRGGRNLHFGIHRLVLCLRWPLPRRDAGLPLP